MTLKQRIDLVDDRIPVLLRKYPLVSAVMIIVPFLIGIGVGAAFW